MMMGIAEKEDCLEDWLVNQAHCICFKLRSDVKSLGICKIKLAIGYVLQALLEKKYNCKYLLKCKVL